MIVPLLAVALAALPATGQSSWADLDVAARLDVRSMAAATPKDAPNGGWFGGGGGVGVTVYGRRILDDDAAPPLQPFLQRLPRFHLEGGGGDATITYPARVLDTQIPSAPFRLYRTSDAGGHFATRADGYLARWAYVAAGLDVEYQSWAPDPPLMGPSVILPHRDSSELMLKPALAAGLRWRDLLISAGWSVTPYRIGADAFRVRFWGNAFVAARAVVRRFVALAARVEVLDGGAAASGAATIWLRRRVGLGVGLEGAHGAFADSPVAYDRAGGQVALTFWFAPRVAASIAYAAAWQRATPVAGFGKAIEDFSFVAHLVTMRISWRLPRWHRGATW